MKTLRIVSGLSILLTAILACNLSSPKTTAGTSTPSDGPDYPNDQAPIGDLNGPWEDNGKEIRLTQSGNSVTALYVEPYVCDHNDGTGQTSQTDLDFNATLNGNTLTGETSVCTWGQGNPLGVGIRPARITLTVSADGLTLRIIKV